MKATFYELQKQIKENELKFTNRKFDSIFHKFYFYFIIEDKDIPQNIIETKNQIKIIVVDYLASMNSYFFILCFEHIIIIIEQSKLIILEQYFFNNLDSNFCFLNESKKLFNELISFRFQELNINKDHFKDELFSFSHEINIKTEIRSINNFWILIKNCLFCFIIQKSYQKVQYNRVTAYLQNKNIFSREYTFQEDDFFTIRHIDGGSSGSVDLIFHYESELIMAKKMNSNRFDKRDVYKREVGNYMEMTDYFPYFPYFLATFEDECNKSLIIEYIDGESLNSCINKLNFNEKIKILFEIMISIQHLHNMNFVYRDLKPNNIIINQSKIAVLIDFDRMLKHDDVNSDNLCVTFDFMSNFSAPELGNGIFCYKSDVYSIGMMISYMFENEINNTSNYENLNQIYRKCTLEDSIKRPNLSELIKFIYTQFFWPLQIQNIFEIKPNENIEKLSETKTIESIQNIHSEKYTLYWIALTEYDNPISQLKFGLIYYKGIQLPVDYMKTFHYFHLSSKPNVKESIHSIGIMYKDGQYVQRDIKKAIEIFIKLSNQNFALSQFSLYLIYFNERNINKALYYLYLSADNNLAAAQKILGDFYRYGEFIGQNINKAIEYYLKAANQDNAEAMFALGLMYSDGIYIERNINKAIEFFSRAAQLNDVNSQLNLAHLFINGKFIKQDVNKEIYYYSLAAEQNSEIAQVILGQIYLKGQFGDIKKSIYYYSKAAKQNNVDAMINLGIIYLTADYIKRDINKSIQYFKQASNLNNSTAQLYLGEIYRNKKYGIQNIQNAIFYFKLSAFQGNPKAHSMLGLIYKDEEHFKESFDHFFVAANHNIREAQYEIGNYLFDGKIVKRDINKALNYYKKAADQNLIDAQYQLGRIYHYGFFVPIDIEKAIYYYKLANIAESLFNLSTIYLNEESLKYNPQEGLKYLTLAADLQYSPALFNLGSFYYNGIYCCKKDINKSLYYLSIAAKKDSPESMFLLAIIYLNGICIKSNISKSIEYLKKASGLNYSNAQYYLGSLYLEGFLVERNVNKAINFLELASENKNDKASFLLGSVYHEGIEIKRDIKKAINYYINASNMKNNFAKNNLGVIYMNNNIGFSIELFEEAISKSNDKVAMLNLAKIYFYNNEISDGKYKNNWIDLLIKSANQNYLESKVFLCVVLIKMIGFITREKIEFEIKKYNSGSLKLANKLYEIIKNEQMEKNENYSFYFKFYKMNNFRYFTEKMIITGDFGDIFLSKNNKINITKEFYEGFGSDLISPK